VTMPSKNALNVESMLHSMWNIVHGGVKAVSNGFDSHISKIKWNHKLGMVEIPGGLSHY